MGTLIMNGSMIGSALYRTREYSEVEYVTAGDANKNNRIILPCGISSFTRARSFKNLVDLAHVTCLFTVLHLVKGLKMSTVERELRDLSLSRLALILFSLRAK